MGIGRGYGPETEFNMDVKTRKTLATRLSSVLMDILVEGSKAAHILPTKSGVKVQASIRGPKRKLKAVAAAKAAPKVKARKTTRKGGAMLKPCPVTGIPNKHRRFSYLMPEARTPENLAKYKGAARKATLSTKAA